jgi:hypothetical protein
MGHLEYMTGGEKNNTGPQLVFFCRQLGKLKMAVTGIGAISRPPRTSFALSVCLIVAEQFTGQGSTS